ncbi:MAG: hypothetical protein P4L59_09525 [Desulfosporosinus sp.]|nr:hypothetical protein [Desulfosporosinus sp.]
MKRRYLILIIILIIIGSTISFNYIKIYSTDETNLENHIKWFINRPTIITDKIDIKKAIDIGNKKYVLYTYNDDYRGDAELVKGLNGKYKIEFTNGGSNLFQYRVLVINKLKYLVVAGKNYDLRIDYVKVTLDGHEYKIVVPQQEYFIVYYPVPNDTQSIFPENGLELFNKNNIEISNDIYFNYSH